MHKIHSRHLPAVCAGFLAFATSASAAVRTLPTPPPSDYIDAESSVVVPFPTDQGRQVALTLSAPFSPTNAIQVALGQDANGDEDLEPEETVLVLGVDCGVPFAWEEGLGRRSRSTVEFETFHSSTSTSHFDSVVFSFKQPQKIADRYTHAKVTTRNMATTNAVILADIKRPGLILLMR